MADPRLRGSPFDVVTTIENAWTELTLWVMTISAEILMMPPASADGQIGDTRGNEARILKQSV